MQSIHFFRRFGVLTIIAIYLLIGIGGIVRATGSGMGCPDWPKCFGMWIPPTSVDQLPINYDVVFGEKLKGEVVFNVYKTWTEYLNRLAGVLIGIFIIISFLSSIKPYFKTDKVIVFTTFCSLVLVVFEGWLGSKVVSTELHPVLISVHMILSIVIVFLMIFAVTRSYNINSLIVLSNKQQINFVILLGVILSLGQILLGTQMREAIDVISKSLGNEHREFWFEKLGLKVFFHSLLGTVVLLINFFIYRLIKNTYSDSNFLNFWALTVFVLVLVAFFSGLCFWLFNMPAFVQPIHLLSSTLILGVQGILYMVINPEFVNKSFV
jgi:heme a synthase